MGCHGNILTSGTVLNQDARSSSTRFAFAQSFASDHDARSHRLVFRVIRNRRIGECWFLETKSLLSVRCYVFIKQHVAGHLQDMIWKILGILILILQNHKEEVIPILYLCDLDICLLEVFEYVLNMLIEDLHVVTNSFCTR